MPLLYVGITLDMGFVAEHLNNTLPNYTTVATTDNNVSNTCNSFSMFNESFLVKVDVFVSLLEKGMS